MSFETTGAPYEWTINEVIGGLLLRGHMIKGWNSIGVVTFDIKESKVPAKNAHLGWKNVYLGIGYDQQAENALAKALLSYVLREERGLEYIRLSDTLPTQSLSLGRRQDSKFNLIAHGGGGIRIFQDAGVVRAESSYGGARDQRDGCTATGENALEAITALTDIYKFNRWAADEARNLPAISLK